ncbi:radical SAM protein [Myxococcota bacterium]|nr:radical SAM protein [Myxococcota bacterium]
MSFSVPGPSPLPTAAQIDRRLRQILSADSAQTGDNAHTDRLMMMLTRSCELRCSYCFVALSEMHYGQDHPPERVTEGVPAGDLSLDTASRALDLLMTSEKPRLSVQLFGGEPTRRWDTLTGVLQLAEAHPRRGGRPLELQLTTNGVGLSDAQLAFLADSPAVVQLSVDGDATGNRFRRPHLPSAQRPEAQPEAITARLNAAGVRWFLNVTVPPAACDELPERYEQALKLKAPALQLNYATGMRFSDAQAEAYLMGLWRVLERDAQLHHPLNLMNWRNAADPAPLCGDVIVDVDGALMQVGGIFHERRFPTLRAAYSHGHLSEAERFEGRRASLLELWRRTKDALSPEEAEVFLSGMRLGAAQDLLCRVADRQLRPR